MAILNGVLLIINGLVTFFYAKTSVPMLGAGIVVAGLGVLAVLLTSQRDDAGTRIGSSLVTAILLIALIVIQAKEMGVVSLF